MDLAQLDYTRAFLDQARYESAAARLILPPLAPYSEGIRDYMKGIDAFPPHTRIPFVFSKIWGDSPLTTKEIDDGWIQNTTGDREKTWGVAYTQKEGPRCLKLDKEARPRGAASPLMRFSFTDTLLLGGAGASLSFRVTTVTSSEEVRTDSAAQLSVRIELNPALVAIARDFFQSSREAPLPSLIWEAAQDSGLIPKIPLKPQGDAGFIGAGLRAFREATPSIARPYDDLLHIQREPSFECEFLTRDGDMTSGVITVTGQDEAGRPILPAIEEESSFGRFLRALVTSTLCPFGEA